MSAFQQKYNSERSGRDGGFPNQNNMVSNDSKTHVQLESIGQLFEEIFHESEKGILLTSESGNILKINQSGKKLLGLSQEIVTSENFSFRNWVENQFDLSFGFNDVKFSEIIKLECTWKKKTNRYEEIKWLRSAPKPFINNVGQGAYLIVLKDITDEIDENRVSCGILTLTSHKLRTPMNHICGGLELMSTVNETTPYSEWSEYMGYISQGVKRLQKDLFSLFRFMDMKRQGVRVGQHELRENREKVIKIVNHISHDLEIKNVFYFLNRLDFTVLSEETLYLVIGEIFTNSAKFHPRKDPLIEIDFEKVVEQDIEYELWTIQDDGRCINATKLKNVVQPFSQHSEFAHTGEVSGFGIGLNAISMQIAFYGGKLWVENRTDKEGFVVKFKAPRIY